MIKELFLAIILGAILGLGVMGSYLALNKKVNTNQNKTAEITPIISDTPISITPTVNNSNDQLTIDSPENETVVSVSKVNFTGITKPNSNLIITTSTKSFTGKSDNSGKFNLAVDLESGVNLIKVTSIDPNDNQTEILTTITYSTAKI